MVVTEAIIDSIQRSNQTTNCMPSEKPHCIKADKECILKMLEVSCY